MANGWNLQQIKTFMNVKNRHHPAYTMVTCILINCFSQDAAEWTI